MTAHTTVRVFKVMLALFVALLASIIGIVEFHPDYARGRAGVPGIEGDAGATGDQGAQGDKGAKGAKGDTGAQGAKGDTGDKGPGFWGKAK